METKIEEFWNDFTSFQMDMILANKNDDQDKFDTIFHFFSDRLQSLQKNLECMFSFDKIDLKGSLIFLTKGNPDLVNIGIKLIKHAPLLDNWEFFMGIGYGGNNKDIAVPYEDSDLMIIPEQLWVNIYKQYKTSNKLHLEIYVHTKVKGLSKSSLHVAVDNLLLLYFGDEIYYNRISRFRIIRRKYKDRQFLPFYAFRDFLRYNYMT